MPIRSSPVFWTCSRMTKGEHIHNQANISMALDSGVASIFGGIIAKTTNCGICASKAQLEYFTSLLLPVVNDGVPLTTLRDCLDSYFAVSKAEGAKCDL